MKVFINGVWYDPEETLIIVKLEDTDKENISNMFPDAKFYIVYNPELKNDYQQIVKDALDKLKS